MGRESCRDDWRPAASSRRSCRRSRHGCGNRGCCIGREAVGRFTERNGQHSSHWPGRPTRSVPRAGTLRIRELLRSTPLRRTHPRGRGHHRQGRKIRVRRAGRSADQEVRRQARRTGRKRLAIDGGGRHVLLLRASLGVRRRPCCGLARGRRTDHRLRRQIRQRRYAPSPLRGSSRRWPGDRSDSQREGHRRVQEHQPATRCGCASSPSWR